MSERSCISCEFSHDNGKKLECRRYPKQAARRHMDDFNRERTEWKYPVIHYGEWCGEYVPLEAKAPK